MMQLVMKPRAKLAPEDFMAPIWAGPMAIVGRRWFWDRWTGNIPIANQGEMIGQPRAELYGRHVLIPISVPMKYIGIFLFDRREGGEQLACGYLSPWEYNWIDLYPGDEVNCHLDNWNYGQ